MRYASVCSGVEAASLAWMPLGWEAAWFSEIEPFPCAVLAERFPNVPNLGDMTKISIQTNGDITYGADAVIPNDGRAIDLIVGGTPCQDASIAGKRAGLVEGERSKLAFTFTRLAYELAAYRGLRWVVWENVPGVFSLNKGWDFAMFLSSIAGRNVEPPKDRWGTFGIVPEGSRGNFGLCWRVLDVQYCRVDGFPRAIPQRRRRVFLVGHIGDWRRAAEVLFEPSCLLGDNPPRRTKRQEVAENAGGCVEKADGFRESSYGAFVDGNESGTLKAVGGVLGGGSETLIKQQLAYDHHPQDGRVTPSDVTHIDARAGTGGGNLPLVQHILYDNQTRAREPKSCGDVSCCLQAAIGMAGNNLSLVQEVFSVDALSSNSMKSDNPNSGFHRAEVAKTLDTTIPTPQKNQGGQCVVDMMGGKGRCGVSQTDVSPVISADTQSHAVARKECVPLDLRNATRDPEKHDAVNRQGVGIGEDGDPMNTVTASSVPGIGWQATVRRLLPVECERLMGFPDDWTKIPWRGKPADECPDSPRYKACGNSMGVNCMRWIGLGIEAVEAKYNK